jgi:hypothetical protein
LFSSSSTTPSKANNPNTVPKTVQELWQLSEEQKKQIKDSWASVLAKEKHNPDPAHRGSSLFFELRSS